MVLATLEFVGIYDKISKYYQSKDNVTGTHKNTERSVRRGGRVGKRTRRHSNCGTEGVDGGLLDLVGGYLDCDWYHGSTIQRLPRIDK